VNLGTILQFITGIDEEPVVGYSIHPKLTFTDAVDGSYGYLPKSSTCTNQLFLPCPSLLLKLPPEEELFLIYDMAFLGSHFGRK